jgi:hypothetical protein
MHCLALPQLGQSQQSCTKEVVHVDQVVLSAFGALSAGIVCRRDCTGFLRLVASGIIPARQDFASE